jgi:hypothetical protein
VKEEPELENDSEKLEKSCSDTGQEVMVTPDTSFLWMNVWSGGAYRIFGATAMMRMASVIDVLPPLSVAVTV